MIRLQPINIPEPSNAAKLSDIVTLIDVMETVQTQLLSPTLREDRFNSSLSDIIEQVNQMQNAAYGYCKTNHIIHLPFRYSLGFTHEIKTLNRQLHNAISRNIKKTYIPQPVLTALQTYNHAITTLTSIDHAQLFELAFKPSSDYYKIPLGTTDHSSNFRVPFQYCYFKADKNPSKGTLYCYTYEDFYIKIISSFYDMPSKTRHYQTHFFDPYHKNLCPDLYL